MRIKVVGVIAALIVMSALVFASRPEKGIAAATDVLGHYDTSIFARVWYGGETFCQFGAVPRADTSLSSFLTAINAAYGTDFDLVTASTHDDCPDFTTFYMMTRTGVSSNAFADVLEALSGSRPPINEMGIAGTRGFSISIPGNRPREFIFVDPTVPPMTNNPDPARSILSEEVLHALTRWDDFETDSIVSLLGENADVTSYDTWFDKNPRGLCLADLYVLELHIGRTAGHLARRGNALDWLEQNHNALADLRPSLQEKLADYIDSRCQL